MRQIKLTGKHNAQLRKRGMPGDTLRMTPFALDQYTTSVESVVEGMKTKRVSKKTQLEQFESLLEKPFGKPYIMAISSFPNDGKAKLLAAYFMEKAMTSQLGGKFPRSTRGKTLPLWHTLMGGFNDRLRDGHDERPSMLILSNLCNLSTTPKLEKVRDLLEMYNDIPRLIVIAGEDPITYFNTKIFMPVNFVLNISTARKTVL